MPDTLSGEQRKRCMSRNRGKHTSPEIIVRQLIYSLGYRYRLHRKGLPGCPDIVFSAKKKVIFINGCYWHRHTCKKGRSKPETRKDFWQTKFFRTKQRDKATRKKLKNIGWQILTIWECQIKNVEKLKKMVTEFLEK